LDRCHIGKAKLHYPIVWANVVVVVLNNNNNNNN